MLCFYCHISSDGSRNFFWTQVGSFIYARVGLGQPPLNLENFPQKSKFFNFFSLQVKTSHRVGSKNSWVKGGSAPYILWVKSMLGLVRVRSHLYCHSLPKLEQQFLTSLEQAFLNNHRTQASITCLWICLRSKLFKILRL